MKNKENQEKEKPGKGKTRKRKNQEKEKKPGKGKPGKKKSSQLISRKNWFFNLRKLYLSQKHLKQEEKKILI